VLLAKHWRVSGRMLCLTPSEVARRLVDLCIHFWRRVFQICRQFNRKITYGNYSTYRTDARSFGVAD
jgi:hypothetical protein